MMLGLDASVNQPRNFPWSAAVDWGARFAILRAVNGNTMDAGYPVHRDNARQAGLLTGSYAMIYDGNMELQAKAFCYEIEGNDDELWPVVDVEWDGLTLDLLRRWMWEYDRHISMALRPLMVYTSAAVWHGLMGDTTTEFAGCPLWVADYGPGIITSTPPKHTPALPHPWKKATIHQWAGDNGRIPGYDGRIDLDLMSDLDAAKKLTANIMGQAVQLQTILTNMDAPPPDPTPTPTHHNFKPMTNQQVINLFSKLFPVPGGFFTVIMRAGLGDIANHRGDVYSGADVEDLTGLTDTERAALIAAVTPQG